jgi:Meiotically up-regulated gene 113
MRDPVSDTYKIGTSRNPLRRLDQLNTARSRNLLLLEAVLVNHPHQVESSLHQIYRQGHVVREWYDLTAADIRGFRQEAERLNTYHETRLRAVEDDDFL